MNINKQTQKGFTLIELLITIAIVAILATIALPAYNSYKDRALFAEVVHSVEPAKTSVDVCVQTRGLGNCASLVNGGAVFSGSNASDHSLGAVIAYTDPTWTITATADENGPKWTTLTGTDNTFIIVGTEDASTTTVNWVENPSGANEGTCVARGFC